MIGSQMCWFQKAKRRVNRFLRERVSAAAVVHGCLHAGRKVLQQRAAAGRIHGFLGIRRARDARIAGPSLVIPVRSG